MRPLTFALILMLAGASLAAEENHLSEVGGLRVVHAWTPATTSPEALVYLSIENTGSSPQTLTGGKAAGVSAIEVVGFGFVGGVAAWTPLPGVDVGPGQELNLIPDQLALRLSGLTAPLTEGGEVEIEVHFGTLHLEVHVAVEAEGATAHSHAGHLH